MFYQPSTTPLPQTPSGLHKRLFDSKVETLGRSQVPFEGSTSYRGDFHAPAPTDNARPAGTRTEFRDASLEGIPSKYLTPTLK